MIPSRVGTWCVATILVAAVIFITVELAWFGLLGDFYGFSYSTDAGRAALDKD
jgi:hypothetical protein